MDLYDVVVVGAGLMGSSAAFHASSSGKKVLLLEQFPLLHETGSSHGSSRIFRVAYTDGTYTKMCIDSLQLWRDLEELSGKTLLETTGELDFVERANSPQLDEVAKVLRSLEQPHEVLLGAQVNKRFPGFSLPADCHAVYSPNAGILNPTLAMQVLQEQSRARGAHIKDNTRVVAINLSEDGDAVDVVLSSGATVQAKQCIVTAGPWTKKLLGNKTDGNAAVQIRPIATYGTYWKCDERHQEQYTPARFPVFINYEDPWIYGLPMQDARHGVKVCIHGGPNVDPDARQDVVEQPKDDVVKMQQFLHKFMPHVDASATTKVDLCMYSMTKDEDFIIDFVDLPPLAGEAEKPAKRIVVGAGFSGHGAKMTPVIGKILADLAIHGETAYPIDKFALSRLG